METQVKAAETAGRAAVEFARWKLWVTVANGRDSRGSAVRDALPRSELAWAARTRKQEAAQRCGSCTENARGPRSKPRATRLEERTPRPNSIRPPTAPRTPDSSPPLETQATALSGRYSKGSTRQKRAPRWTSPVGGAVGCARLDCRGFRKVTGRNRRPRRRCSTGERAANSRAESR